MIDVQAMNNHKIIETYGVISEMDQKDLKIHQLELDLASAKEDLAKIMKSAPNIDDLYHKINDSMNKIHTLECANSSLKIRVSQLQQKNNEMKKLIEKFSSENKAKIEQSNSNNTFQKAQFEEKITQLQKDASLFLDGLSKIIGLSFSSFNDVLNYAQSGNFSLFHQQLEVLKEKNVNLQTKVDDYKKKSPLLETVRNERNQLQLEFEEILEENKELKQELIDTQSQLECARKKLQKHAKTIENSKMKNHKLCEKCHKLKSIIKEREEKDSKIADPRVTQLENFLQQKTEEFNSLNQKFLNISNQKAEIERQNSLLIQKGREYLTRHEIIQNEISNLKIALQNAIDEKNLISTKLSKSELEKASLASKVQSADQKCILLTAKIQDIEAETRNAQNSQNEFNEMINILEKIIDTQKKDVLRAISIQHMLAQRIFKQNEILHKEENLLMHNAEQSNILKAQIKSLQKENDQIKNNLMNVNQSPQINENESNYLLVGYIKELLLPQLSRDLQKQISEMLDDTRYTIVQRLKKVFSYLISGKCSIADHTNQFYFNPEDMSHIEQYLNTTFLSNKEAIITQLKTHQSLFEFVKYLILKKETIEKEMHQFETSLCLELKIPDEHLTLAKIIAYIDTHLIQKLTLTEAKLNEYREVARVLKNELQKKLKEIENLQDKNDENLIGSLQIELSELKSNEKQLKMKIQTLKKESDQLRMKLQNAILDLEKEKQNSATLLNDQKKQFEVIMNQLTADSTNHFTSSKLMLADIQKKFEQSEKRYHDEINELKKQLNEQVDSKKEIAAKYQQIQEETRNNMNSLLLKIEEMRKKNEKLTKEISQVRLEKKALEFQLENHTTHDTCFATILEENK